MIQAPDRDSRRATLDWAGPALTAGALGGLVKILYLMAASWVLGAGFWTPANMAGATFEPFAPPAIGFELLPSLTGMLLHVATCAVWGLVFGALVMRRPGMLRSAAATTLAGLGLGLVFAVTAYVIGPFFNPYSAGINPLLGYVPPLVGNLLFGLVTAFALRAGLKRNTLTITMAPEQPVAAEDRTLR